MRRVLQIIIIVMLWQAGVPCISSLRLFNPESSALPFLYPEDDGDGYLVTNRSEYGEMEERFFVQRDNHTIRNGTYKQLYKGIVITEGSYLNNMRTGVWTFTDSYKSVVFSGIYKQERQDGIWSYKEGDIVRSLSYYENGRLDSIYSYDRNGKLFGILRYADDTTIHRLFYYSDGTLREKSTMKKSRYNGRLELYFPNGRIHRVINYTDGRLDSCTLIRDINGNNIDSGKVINGEGTLFTYYISDSRDSSLLQVKSAEEIETGVPHGLCQTYDSSGVLLSEGMCMKGYQTGEWLFYNEDRTVKSTKLYKESVRVYQWNPTAEAPFAYERDDFKGPMFPDGSSDVVTFIHKNFKPTQMKEGKVYVDLLFTITGEPRLNKIRQSSDPHLTEAAIKAVQLLPRCSTYLSQGVPKSVVVTIPITFRLR